jgi:hypothetical protein
MIWPHWHYERWTNIRYDKLRCVRNIIRMWVGNKQNASVIRWANNQMHFPKSPHEQNMFTRYLKEPYAKAFPLRCCDCHMCNCNHKNLMDRDPYSPKLKLTNFPEGCWVVLPRYGCVKSLICHLLSVWGRWNWKEWN